MPENIGHESEPNPEKSEKDKLLDEHRQLDAEFSSIESRLDLFFRKPKPDDGSDDPNEAEISGLFERRRKIIDELGRIEQTLMGLNSK